MMSEKQVSIVLEDVFGRVQTSIRTELSAPQLMDKLIKQSDEISYWKNKISSLLWILHKFEEQETIKSLIEEIDRDNFNLELKWWKEIYEQQDTITHLKEENEQLQQKYSKLCNEMANIYSKYIFIKEFDENTNPNESVKYVLRELMQNTKEVR